MVVVVGEPAAAPMGLTAALEAAGFAVARSPAAVPAVLDALSVWRPVALVLDWPDPPDAARDVLRAVRARGTRPDLPVLVVAESGADAARPALADGADDFVAGASETPEVAVRVEALIRRRRGADAAGGPVLRAHLFGPLRIEVGDRVVIDEGFARRKAKALFAYLYLNRGKYVPKYRLLDALWPDADDVPPGRLKQTVSVLRAAIEPSASTGGPWLYIGERNGRYFFDTGAAYWADVEAFEQQVALARECRRRGDVDGALAHYRNAFVVRRAEFLPEFSAEDWAVAEATRLQELYLEALEDAAPLHAERGEYAMAVALLRRVIQEDPLREGAYASLMRVLVLEGKQAEALRTYQRLADVLARAFQVAPQREITRLYEAICRERAPSVGEPVPLDPSDRARAAG